MADVSQERRGGGGGWRRLVGPTSFRHRARALSTQTRGPYSVRPWSCYCKKRPCFIKLPEGRRTHQPPPQRTLVLKRSGKEISDSAYVSASSRWVGYLSPAAWVRQGCRPSSSYMDVRSTVHASAWTRWRARRRGEIPHPPRRREPPTPSEKIKPQRRRPA